MNDYIRGDEKGVEEVVEILSDTDVSNGGCRNARATVLSFGQREQIDQFASKLNAPRDVLLGEIEYRQKTLAAKLRRAADTVDGDFKEIDTEAA